jgi:hypothetical protein
MFNLMPNLHNLKTSIIGLVLLLASSIIGLIWLTIGLYSWLVSLVGSLWGPMLLGALCLLPLLIFILARLITKPGRAQALFSQEPTHLHITTIVDSLKSRSPALAAAAAIAAGVLATRFPNLLGVLAQLISAWVSDTQRQKTES